MAICRFVLPWLLVAPACAAPPAPAAPTPAAPVTAAPPAHVAAPATTPIPELPALVRRLLDGRMIRHGGDLGAVEVAVKAADWATVAERARAIADEPRLARPVGDTTLNAVIPPAFFDLQDLLHHRAEALEVAARAGDGERVRAAYEALGETCGQCHAVWFPVP